MRRPLPFVLLLAILAIAGGALVGVGVAGISGNGAASPADGAPTAAGPPEATPSVTFVPTPSPTPVPTPVLMPDPLDGTLVSPADAARHPIAVMIDDLAPARPQSGFSAASIIWQAPAEGGIPRYMMIFGPRTPGPVGPVRSARYYFIAWAAEWKAAYVHAGGSPQALSTLAAQGGGQLVYNADQFAHGASFWRVTDRFGPHNLYTDGAHLRALANAIGARAPASPAVWQFGPDAPLDERPEGGTIEIDYPANRILYTYDPFTNTYPRTVTTEGTEKDAGTGIRVAPKNVVVMLMHFGPLNDREPAKHRLEATVIGSGPAWIATNGRTIVGTWRKDSLTGPTLFYDKAGNPVTLTAGQTFVQVVPYGWGIKIHAGVLPSSGTPAPGDSTGSPSPSLAPSPS